MAAIGSRESTDIPADKYTARSCLQTARSRGIGDAAGVLVHPHRGGHLRIEGDADDDAARLALRDCSIVHC